MQIQVVISSSCLVTQDGWRKVQFKNQKKQFQNSKKRENNLNPNTCELSSQTSVMFERSL